MPGISYEEQLQAPSDRRWRAGIGRYVPGYEVAVRERRGEEAVSIILLCGLQFFVSLIILELFISLDCFSFAF